MRWPKFHTCHIETDLVRRELEFIPLTPAKNASEYEINDEGLRICPVCSSLHPQDAYQALTEDGATIASMNPDGPPLRYRIVGESKAATHFFHTPHLGDHGYEAKALRALCRELSKAQSKYVFEPDVDGVYWKPKEEAGKIGRGVLKLSKKFKVNLDSDVAPPKKPAPDPVSLEEWKKTLESDVRKFKKERRGW